MEHPITPPPELVQQLMQQWRRTAPHPSNETEHYHYITLCAAQWGADQELEACCGELRWRGAASQMIKHLRAARRPKPPSLKEQALALVEQHEDGWRPAPKDWDTIRLALEALPND